MFSNLVQLTAEKTLSFSINQPLSHGTAGWIGLHTKEIFKIPSWGTTKANFWSLDAFSVAKLSVSQQWM